jgi:hypothetical protein
MSQRAPCPYYSTCEPSGDRRAGRTRSSHSLMMNLAFLECLAARSNEPRRCQRNPANFVSEVMNRFESRLSNLELGLGRPEALARIRPHHASANVVQTGRAPLDKTATSLARMMWPLPQCGHQRDSFSVPRRARACAVVTISEVTCRCVIGQR